MASLTAWAFFGSTMMSSAPWTTRVGTLISSILSPRSNLSIPFICSRSLSGSSKCLGVGTFMPFSARPAKKVSGKQNAVMTMWIASGVQTPSLASLVVLCMKYADLYGLYWNEETSVRVCTLCWCLTPMDMATSDPIDQPTMWALKMCRWSIRWITSSAISSISISSFSYSVIPTPRLSMVMTL